MLLKFFRRPDGKLKALKGEKRLRDGLSRCRLWSVFFSNRVEASGLRLLRFRVYDIMVFWSLEI